MSDQPDRTTSGSAATAMTVIREALAAPHMQDDPASAALTPQERLENRASVIYWALHDADLLTESERYTEGYAAAIKDVQTQFMPLWQAVQQAVGYSHALDSFIIERRKVDGN